MGIGGISIWQLLIIFVIAVLIFGTSRLKTVGSDLGGAIKGFRKAMESGDADPSRSAAGSMEEVRPALGKRADGDPSERAESSDVESRV